MKLRDGDEVVDMLLVPGAEDAVDDEDVPDGLAEPEPTEPTELDLSEDGEEPLPDEEDDASVDEPATTLLTVTSNGFGKRTPIPEYRRQGRNGKGIIAHAIGRDTGELVGASEVGRDDQVMLITNTGRVIRIGAGDVRLVKSRSSKGVRLMRLEKGERLVDLELLPPEEVAEEE